MGLETKDRFDGPIVEFLDSLRIERGASPHTLDAYGRDLRFAAAFLAGQGCTGWREVDDHSIEGYVTDLAPRVSASTLRRRLASLRGLLAFLQRQGAGPTCRTPSLSGARLPKRLPKALSQVEVERLLASPDISTPVGLRDRALLEALYGCGLRASEVAGLTFQCLSMDTASLRADGKRGKTRWVPIPRGTMEWLERYLASSRPMLQSKPSSKVFLAERGGSMSRSLVYRVLERHARRSGLRAPIGPHVLRHTYAVHLLQGGADLRVVQELLGHASLDTTQVYTELKTDHLRKAYDQAHPRS